MGKKQTQKEVQSEVQSAVQESTSPLIEAAGDKIEKNIDENTYDKFCDLKFLVLQEATLSDERKKELAHLTELVRSSEGATAVRTVTAAINTETLRMVEGMPMPARYYKIIGQCTDSAKKYYLG